MAMTRGNIIILAVLVIGIVAGIGYYASNWSSGDLSAQCTTNFDRLAAGNNNDTMEVSEFLAYGSGVTENDFSKADLDKDQKLTSQEFCAWDSARTTRG